MSHRDSTSASTEVTTRYAWESNVPTTYIRLGDDEITVVGYPRCSIFRVSDRKTYEHRREDISDLGMWAPDASHKDVVTAMTAYLKARQVVGVYHACPPCPMCNGTGEVMGLVAA